MTKNIKTEIWGPSAWSFIYYVFISHKNEYSKLKSFLNELSNILPCTKCQEDLTQYIKNNPLHLEKDSIQWLYKFNKHIRKKTKKRQPQLSFLQWKKLYGYYLEEDCGCNKSKLKNLNNINLYYLFIPVTAFTVLGFGIWFLNKKTRTHTEKKE